MSKLSKLTIIALIVVAIIATLSVSVSAYSSADLKEYLTTGKTINGMVYEPTIAQKDAITNYLAANPVTDAQAAQIKAYLDNITNTIAASGVTDVNQLSASTKASIIADAKAAGAVAGITVTVDQTNKVVTLTASNGSTIVSVSYNGAILPAGATSGSSSTSSSSDASSTSSTTTLLYTGANYAVICVSIVAIIAVAVVAKKHVCAA